MQDPWRIDLLGQLRLHRGDRVITRFSSPKVGLLLAYLAYFGERQHLREDLVEMLWPESSPHSARNRLSQVVVWLRPLLEPDDRPDIAPGSVLIADRTGLHLNPQMIRVDAVDFDMALTAGSRETGSGYGERIAVFEGALALYSGPLLPGFYNDWVLEERRRLEEAHIAALEHLAGLYRERGQGGDLLVAERRAREAVAADPTREESHRELMRVLAAAGQGAAALRQFHELEQILARELDERPSAETVAVAEQIRGQPVAAPVTPSPRRAPVRDLPVEAGGESPAPDWAGLPVPLTRFFGRDTEIAQAAQMLSEGSRLITLLGTGGCGKTRLAIEIGRRFRPLCAGAVAFVPLADLSDPTLIATEIADSLRLKRAGENPLEQIIARLADSPRAILILDNLEHLVHGASGLLRALLQRLPELTILTTSRQRLGVEGEVALHVLPLPLADTRDMAPETLGATPSIRLFVDRAQAVRPSFRLTPANASTVAALCARLEGIPLAIELCAAWSEILTPAQMLAQVEDRFVLLVGRREDLPDRHRTLRAAIEYSFTLLPPDLKSAFLRLSVFRGGWTLEASAAVLGAAPAAEAGLHGGETLDLLIRLRERSLIVAEESSLDDTMRYRMLETLREYGATEREKQEGSEPVSAQRHAGFFREVVASAQANLIGPEGPVWLARLEAEHDNIRTVLQWYRDIRAVGEGLWLAAGLLGFWDIRGYFREGLEYLDIFLSLGGSDPAIPAYDRVRARFARARLLLSLGEFEESYRAAVETLEAAKAEGEAKQAVLSLYFLGTVSGLLERYAEARRFHEESLAGARALNDLHSIGNNLTDLGNLANRAGHFTEARVYLEEARIAFHDAGLITNEAVVINNLGLVARYEGDYEQARALFQQALEIHHTSAFRLGFAIAQINLGTISRLQAETKQNERTARYTEAREHLNDGLRISRELGSQYVTAWALKELGSLAIAEGESARGVRLLGAADNLREKLRVSFSPSDPDSLRRDRAASIAALGEPAFDSAWKAGRDASPERIVEEELARLLTDAEGNTATK